MRSDVMMLLKIARQNATQMALVEDDDVIQAFSADRTDETPRTQGLRGQRLQKHNTTEARGLSDCLSVPPMETGLGAVAGARTNTSSGWGAIFGRIAKNV
jgi:hypothetical protein